MDNEGNADANNSRENVPNPEQIETSVIAMDSQMIIIQPDDLNNQPANVMNDVQFVVEIPQVPQPPMEVHDLTGDANNDSVVSPTNKKRKRSPKVSPSPKKAPEPLNDDDDDGTTCSICLDLWEWRGPHRLVILKCGHLFGDSCIRRWIQECPAHAKCCPTCKTKAALRDIRIVYAKRVVVADKIEEERLNKIIEEERTKLEEKDTKIVELQSSLCTMKLEMAILREQYSNLESRFSRIQASGLLQPQTSSRRESIYKMSLDKNIELNRQGGCRAMIYGKRIQTLIVSQKSTAALFPGYGVRFISGFNLQPTVFFHVASKSIRDLSLDSDEQLLAAATQDKSAFIYSITNHTPVASVTPCESPIWATSFDNVRQRCLHVGSAQGNTYVYDVRNCMAYLEQWSTPGDMSPVISITTIASTMEFQFGGFIVCKLQSLWFYEYTNSQRTEQTKLTVEGPFVSINYDEQTKILLIATRPTPKYPQSRYIIGSLMKLDQSTVFRVNCTVCGSNSAPIMSRSTQIHMPNDNLVAAYLQDTKMLTTWNSKTAYKTHSFNVDDCILDMCSMNTNNQSSSSSLSLLATLSESKCRIFQINLVN